MNIPCGSGDPTDWIGTDGPADGDMDGGVD